jgi:hypothetical protein
MQALLKNQNLKTLALDYNSIGDAGVVALASTLATHKSLYRLSLAGKHAESGFCCQCRLSHHCEHQETKSLIRAPLPFAKRS